MRMLEPSHSVLYFYRQSWRTAVLREWLGPGITMHAVDLRATIYAQPPRRYPFDAVLVDWCPELASVLRRLDDWLEEPAPAIAMTDGAAEQGASAYAFGADAVESFPVTAAEVGALVSTWRYQSDPANDVRPGPDLNQSSTSNGFTRQSPADASAWHTEDRNGQIEPRIRLDPDRFECWIDGRHVYLPATPFRVLHFLVERAGGCCTRQELFDAVWGPEYMPASDVLATTIRRLRRTLSDAGLEDCLLTVRRVGYRLVQER